MQTTMLIAVAAIRLRNTIHGGSGMSCYIHLAVAQISLTCTAGSMGRTMEDLILLDSIIRDSNFTTTGRRPSSSARQYAQP